MSYPSCARHVPWHGQRINLRKNFQLCHVPKPIEVGTGTLGRHERQNLMITVVTANRRNCFRNFMNPKESSAENRGFESRRPDQFLDKMLNMSRLYNRKCAVLERYW